jgi:cytochrome c556
MQYNSSHFNPFRAFSVFLFLIVGLLPLANADLSPETKKIMKRNVETISTIGTALLKDDLEAVYEAAESMVNSPGIPEADQKQIIDTVGDKKGQFQRYFREFRTTARELADAAQFKDLKTSQNLYLRLLRGCMNCHNDYRNIVREKLKK